MFPTVQSFSLGLIKRGLSRYFLTHSITSHRPPPFLSLVLSMYLRCSTRACFGPALSSSILLHPIFNLIIWRASISLVVLGATLTLSYKPTVISPICFDVSLKGGTSIAIIPLNKVKGKYPAVLAYSDHVAKELDNSCSPPYCSECRQVLYSNQRCYQEFR